MALLRVSSPHMTQSGTTGHVMLLVMLATLPGLTMLTYFFGWGSLINIVWAGIVALCTEAIILTLRGRSLGFYLRDYSALVTALLLGLALPPSVPWWLTLIATSFAIIIAKHLYGGLGNNLFNPAMIGYALVLIAFPLEMTSWLAPKSLTAMPGEIPSFITSLTSFFSVTKVDSFDVMTMATPLDSFKHKGALTAAELWAKEPILSPKSWQSWQYISLGYLMGGLYLLYRKVFTWHAPISMLAVMAAMSALFWWYDPNQYASPQLHLLGGATMLGAFFIVTDPVTSATSVKGKLYYGACIGLLVYAIRTWGNYPDAVAFSVLLMNFAAPFIDFYTKPRTYGHQRDK
ncbi:MAG: electron transport complex subunit RsxD [Pseudomonadales bacterium]|nr:electron transport complex subunit RsxD [Pseudomonadales bacterium]